MTRKRKLALYIDGVRIFKCGSGTLGRWLIDIAYYCDNLTICLSKGLGTPVGSLLCGDAAYIEQARRWRKMTGGGIRQTGILAAASLYALQHNVARLKEDHNAA